jgi:hypothetical protein
MRPFHSGLLGKVLGCGTRRDTKLKLLGSVLVWEGEGAARLCRW